MASPPSSHLRLDIQGLRAVAVIAVVLFHTGIILPGGFVGVDMFFAISGFVITLTLLRAKEKTGKISLGQFYLRRFRRLAPALGVVIVFTLIASSLVLSPLGTQQNAALTALAAALSLGNIAIALTTGNYFAAPAELNPFLHTWSLGVEEQFYVVFPVAIVAGFFLVKNRMSPRQTMAWVVGIITVASFLLTIGREFLPHPLDDSAFFGFYSPVTRAWEFGVGALIALWSIGRQKNLGRAIRSSLSVAGFSGLIYSFLVISGQLEFPGLITVVPVLATGALIIAGTGDHGWASRLLSTKPLTAVGDWSYSIYLWHWPFVSLAKVLWEGSAWAAPIAALISFAPAVLVYYLVEQRFRFRKFEGRKSLGLAVGGFVGIPVAVAGIFWIGPTVLSGDQLAKAVARPIGYELGCHVEPDVEEDPGACFWPEDKSSPTKPPLYLVGDSNAAHYADGLVVVASAENRPLTVMTARVCPFLLDGGHSASLSLRSEDCLAWQENVGNILKSSQPGIVIISTSDAYWLGEAGPLRLMGQNLTPAATETIGSLDEGLRNTVRQLSAVGHDVVLVQTVPHWTGEHQWDLADCSLWEVLGGCNQTMPTSFYLTRSQDVRKAFESAESEGATVVDLLEDLCPRNLCQSSTGKYWVYRDGNHISQETSLQLAPVWSERLPAAR